MDDSLGVVPIEKKFLQPNYLFAMQFREGFTFGRVIRRRICQYKPYSLIDETGATVNIAPNSAQAELRFRDPRNKDVDILYLDTSTNSGWPWLLHGGIGIMPQYIYMYPRFPEGKEILGKFPNVDPIKPSAGDLLGYVNSLKSPYEEPTDAVEYVIPPKLHIGAEYFNKDTRRAHNPVMNLLFSVYWFQTFTRAQHPHLIAAIAKRMVPAAFLTVGFGDLPQELGSDLAEDWKVEPMSLDEAAVLASPTPTTYYRGR